MAKKALKLNNDIFLDSSSVIYNRTSLKGLLDSTLIVPRRSITGTNQSLYTYSFSIAANNNVDFPIPEIHTLGMFAIENNRQNVGFGLFYDNGVSNVVGNYASFNSSSVHMQATIYSRIIIITNKEINITIS